MNNKRIAIFASGSGSNAENIYNYFKENGGAEVSLILCNKADAYVLERAKRLGIESMVFTAQQIENGEILSILKDKGIDFIVLAGYLKKIPDDIIAAYPDKIVNIHPSLLPKYGGKGMYGMRVHEAVKASGDDVSGITIHYLNDRYDEGSVIFQKTCPVLPTDTPEEIATKVHALEYQYYPQVIAELIV